MSKDSITLSGTITKVVDRFLVKQPQQAQISFKGAEFLYDEIRILNTHGWEVGRNVELTIRLV
jgi:hypothetical protein